MAFRRSTGLRNKMLGISTQMLTNGTFDTDTTGWTAVDATLSSVAGGQSSNCLQIAETGGANPGKAYQDITTVVGRIYIVNFYFKQGTAASGRLIVGTTADDDSINVGIPLSDADWTLYRVPFLATATTTRITLVTDDATATETSLFDEVTVHEAGGSFKEIMKNCKCNVYTGSQPASADAAASGTLLYTLTESGDGSTGLTFDDAASGIVTKADSETWQGVAGNAGTAGWFRFYEDGDDPSAASTTEARLDGACATSGAQMNMSNTSIANGSTQTVTEFAYTEQAG